MALSGMVQCPHALASEAGVESLKAGGSDPLSDGAAVGYELRTRDA